MTPSRDDPKRTDDESSDSSSRPEDKPSKEAAGSDVASTGDVAPDNSPDVDPAYREFLNATAREPRRRKPKPWRLVFRISTIVWLTIAAAGFFSLGREVGFLLLLAPIAMGFLMVHLFAPLAVITVHSLFDSRWVRWLATALIVLPIGQFLIVPTLYESWQYRAFQDVVGMSIGIGMCWVPQVIGVAMGWVLYRRLKAAVKREQDSNVVLDTQWVDRGADESDSAAN